jgi:type III secretion protein HrpB1
LLDLERRKIVTYKECGGALVGGLTKMLWTASQFDHESDFDDLLEAIRVLRPTWSGGGTVLAWRYVRRHAWVDARRVLEDDDEQAKRSGLHAALMAVCLFGLEDPLWHGYARAAAEQRESAEAATIGNRLLERAARLGMDAQPVSREPDVAAQDHGGFSPSMTWVRA